MDSNVSYIIFIEIVFRTIVHQALEDRFNPNDIENHGPFPGNDFGKLYLGEGSYFWDDHLELAHWWGKKHIKKDYVICEANLEIEKDEFCDLVGCRQDMILLKQLIHRLNLKKMALGKVIEILKDLNSRPHKKGIFPYTAIRAVDISSTTFEQECINFSEDRNGITSLTPIYLICLIARNRVPLSNYRIVYPEQYVQ